MNIGVIGGSSVDEKVCKIAYEIGKYLASFHATVFCGGLSGVMECVSHGVYDGHGTVVGILPGYKKMEGNRYLTIRIPTGIGYARNFMIIRASDVLIAIDGSSGTLSEAAFAVTEGKDVVSIFDIYIPRKKDGEGHVYVIPDAEEAVKKAVQIAKDSDSPQ
ncbi:MAG: TIGR00725 family protein [Thermoplasmata archaeon]